MRDFSLIDNICIQLQQGMDSLTRKTQGTTRPEPKDENGFELSEKERKQSAALMRVNHAGEIAAQALYNGQAITARNPEVKQRLHQSGLEEADHLAWCKNRVESLGEQTSLLGPVWYWGSFSIGALAGIAGDKWSLGFIKETEDQVIEHLQGHLKIMPKNDKHSRAVVGQMIKDEKEHGDMAVRMGGVPLPGVVKAWMKLTAKIMTTTSYRI